jgi:hypothetical protein
VISVKLVSKEQIAFRVIPHYLTTWEIADKDGEVSTIIWDTRSSYPNPLIRQKWRKLEDARIYEENQVILDRLANTVYNQDYQYRNRCLRGW